MVSSFFKTRSFAVLTPAISTFPCMRSAPSDPETSWPQYDRRAFFLYWELLSHFARRREWDVPSGAYAVGGG